MHNAATADYPKSVGCHLKGSEVEALYRLCDAEQRSVAGAVHSIIRDTLVARGYLQLGTPDVKH